MAQADSNRFSISYIRETTWGTTPGTPTLTYIPINAGGLLHAKQTVISNRLRSDRQIPGILEVGAEGAGGFPFELSHSDFEQFFAAVVSGTVVTASAGVRTLENGVVDHFYTLEEHYADIEQYRRFFGMYVDTLSLNIEARQIVTGQMTFVGEQGDAYASTVAASTVAASLNPIMTATSNVGTLTEGGVSLTTAIRQIQLNINANRAGRPAVGNKYAIGVRSGRLEVTGRIMAYFEDIDLLNKAIDHTPTDLTIPFTDADGNQIQITIKELYLSGNPDAPGVNTDVMLPLDFSAQIDPSSETTIEFTFEDAAD
jgi:hypothetical protein